MSSTTDRLYNLLPAVYRARDQKIGGEALRALLGVIETEYQAILDDIGTLYDNWFIETCQDWVVPYIGDLLGVRELNAIPNGAFSRRAYVANTLAYRKRKGTPAVVEQLARDVTGWPSRVVEYFQLMGQTQHLNHIRAGNTLLDIRGAARLERIGTPFEQAAYTAEVRRISRRAGRYNIPSVGIYQWRLGSYPVYEAQAAVVNKAAEGVGSVAGKFFRFSQLNADMPLFNRPETEQSITTLAQEINVPGALRRRPLFDELEARRAAVDAGRNPVEIYFDEQPVIELRYREDAEDPYTDVPPENIRICHLGVWHEPEDADDFLVDPVLGRIAAKGTRSFNDVRVTYSYGFSADVGGGSYNRRSTLVTATPGDTTVHTVTVAKNDLPDGPPDYDSLVDAVLDFVADEDERDWIINVADSSTYADFVTLEVAATSSPEGSRRLIIQAHDGERPTLQLGGAWLIDSADATLSITLNGFLVIGAVELAGECAQLELLHTTLVPGRSLTTDGEPAFAADSLNVAIETPDMQIVMQSCITGPINVGEFAARSIAITDSIIDGFGGPGQGLQAVYGGTGEDDAVLPAAPASFTRSTVLGGVSVSELTLASESIFTDTVIAKRRQVGCARFCYLPPGSRTPQRYYCQPDTAALKDTAGNVLERVKPQFTSLRYGDPAYAQLTTSTPLEIRSGAEDGSEMGAFNQLKQPQREANLRIGLEEYMRLGLDTGTFFVT